jgi:hypothetical protein
VIRVEDQPGVGVMRILGHHHAGEREFPCHVRPTLPAMFD